MMKRRKMLGKSFLMFLLLLSATVPNGAVADSYLDHSGKMDFKTDRIQQTEEERKRKQEEEKNTQKETIDLFKPRIEKQMKEIQAKQQAEMNELESILFTDKYDNAVVQKEQDMLFASTYKAKSTVAENGSAKEDTNTNMFTGIIAGFVVLLCSSIYFGIKKFLV
jgi:type VII secretion protein EssA